MKLSYKDFADLIRNEFEKCNGVAKATLLNGKPIEFYLPEKGDGIRNSNYKQLICKFDELYAIYEEAISLKGKMMRGNPQNGARIGSDKLPCNSIDGLISLKFYSKCVGDKTTRRSTYYAAILDWAGIATNHWGGYITIKEKFMG